MELSRSFRQTRGILLSQSTLLYVDPVVLTAHDILIKLQRFHFRVRRQELNSVEGGTFAVT